MTNTTAQLAAARIKQALRPIDDDGQSHGGPDGWSPTAEEISEWQDSFHEAASPEALRALLAERDELAKDAATLRDALEAFRKAHEMPVTGDTSSFEWGKQTMRYPGEHSGGYLCSKHGLGYTSSCVCCRDEFTRYEEQLERKARWNRDTALREANKLARAALTNKD